MTRDIRFLCRATTHSQPDHKSAADRQHTRHPRRSSASANRLIDLSPCTSFPSGLSGVDPSATRNLGNPQINAVDAPAICFASAHRHGYTVNSSDIDDLVAALDGSPGDDAITLLRNCFRTGPNFRPPRATPPSRVQSLSTNAIGRATCKPEMTKWNRSRRA
jgi:hypothetical protein